MEHFALIFLSKFWIVHLPASGGAMDLFVEGWRAARIRSFVPMGVRSSRRMSIGIGSRAWSAALACMLVCGSVPAAEMSQGDLLRQLEELQQRQAELSRMLEEGNRQIEDLAAEIKAGGAASVTEPVPADTPSAATLRDFAPAPIDPNSLVSLDDSPLELDTDDDFGKFQPGGRGFKLANTPWGDVNFSAWGYVRFLNQKGLDETYTDAFGRTRDVKRRSDIQLNKVNLYMKGWVYDPKLRYLFYVWTANANQGESAQVVVAGNISYHFNDSLDVGAGIGALPGTRSLLNTFPYWNKVDTRPIADEFFRPSYTTGIWAGGELADGLMYKVMVGNNLSQLGVSALELDGSMNTFSGALWWMPTTGEFGPAGGYGDFENHQELATNFGVHVTRSREDRQSQPGLEDNQNTQIRLSDGTVIFSPDAFATGGRINRATYLMSSLTAAAKYQGYSISADYYFRWVDDFVTEGFIPEDDLFDHGFTLQATTMLIPKTLQPYIAGSKIFGEYGNPWDISVGVNWFPLQQRLFRVNAELLYLNDSPVGYSSVPFVVGGNGTVGHVNVELMF